MTVDEAAAVLEEGELVIGEVTEQARTDVDAGIVVATDPLRTLTSRC